MNGPKSVRHVGALIPIALLVLLGISAWAQVFTGFRLYDDEGYVLYTVRQFQENLRIYDQFFTQYGPVYYLYTNSLLEIAGSTADHDWTRAVTVLHWLGALLFVYLSSRAMGASVAGQGIAVVAAFFILNGNVSEPGHPGIAIAFFYSILLWLILRWGRSRIGWILGGMILAVIAGMKVNSGAFLALSVGWGLLLAHGFPKNLTVPFFAVYPILLVLLILDRMTEPGVLWLAALVLVGYAGTVVSIVLRRPRGTSSRTAPVFLINCGLSAVLTLALLLFVMRGADALTWRGLLDGVVLGPMEFAASYRAPYYWTNWGWIAATVALVSIGLCLHPKLRARTWEHYPLIASTALFAAAMTERGWEATWIGPIALETLYPCAWLIPALLAKRNGSEAGRQATWVLILVMWAVWQAYPVPGSQIGWALFPLALLWSHWVCALAVDARERVACSHTFVREELLSGFLLVSIVVYAVSGWSQYRDNVALDLPGAREIRLSRGQVADLRVMVNTARAYGDMLFTYPGMLSLNLLSGVPSPGTFHVTHWYSLLDEAQQDRILEEMDASPQPVLISSPNHIAYLRRHHLLPDENRLLNYIDDHYCTAFGTYYFRFMIPCRRNRLFPVGSFIRVVQAQSENYTIRLIRDPEWEEVRAMGTMAGERKAFSWYPGMYERRAAHMDASGAASQVETVILSKPILGTGEPFQVEYIQFLDADGREVDFAVPATRYFIGGGPRAGD